MENQCLRCERTLTTYVDDCRTAVDVQGEVDCCCGDIDETSGRTVYVNAECVDCCPSQRGVQIWEGKSAGGGYYIVNPSF